MSLTADSGALSFRKCQNAERNDSAKCWLAAYSTETYYKATS